MKVESESNGLVLLVEDDPADVLIARRAFKRAKIQNRLVVAGDGDEAWDYLCRPDSERPCLVLLDLNLPRVGGMELLARMKGHERLRDIPVVVLSTSSDRADVEGSYHRGANTYVTKPVDFACFVDAIATIGHYWLDVAEVPQHH